MERHRPRGLCGRRRLLAVCISLWRLCNPQSCETRAGTRARSVFVVLSGSISTTSVQFCKYAQPSQQTRTLTLSCSKRVCVSEANFVGSVEARSPASKDCSSVSYAPKPDMTLVCERCCASFTIPRSLLSTVYLVWLGDRQDFTRAVIYPRIREMSCSGYHYKVSY